VSTVVGMAPTFPEALDKVNAQQIVDVYGDKLGIDPNIVRTDEEALARLQGRQEAEAAAAQADQLQTLSQGAQALGRTPTRGGQSTALDDVMSQAGAGA